MSRLSARLPGIFRQCHTAYSRSQPVSANGECSPQLQQLFNGSRCSTDVIRSFAASATSQAPPALSSRGSKPGGGSSGREMGPILLLPAAVAAALGSWQLARRAEKQTEIDNRLAAMQVQCTLVATTFTLQQQCSRGPIVLLDDTALYISR